MPQKEDLAQTDLIDFSPIENKESTQGQTFFVIKHDDLLVRLSDGNNGDNFKQGTASLYLHMHFHFPYSDASKYQLNNLLNSNDATHFIFLNNQSSYSFSDSGLLFSVSIGKNTLERLLTHAHDLYKELIHSSNFSSVKPMTVNIEMIQIIRSILNCKYPDPFRYIYMEAKVQELLALQLSNINFSSSLSVVYTSSIIPKDKEKLYKIHALITSEINISFSLAELASEAGLNIDKLKKGYKELFGITVFGHIHEMKMEKARDLIVSKKYSISQISELVGYRNPQHFTTAFKKRFGLLPRDYNKQHYLDNNNKEKITN